MNGLPFVKRLSSQQSEERLSKLTSTLFESGDSEHNRWRIGEYLRLCRSHTIQSKAALSPLLRENHGNAEEIAIDPKAAQQATFWICDMIKSDCLLMFVCAKFSFLVNAKLQIFEIVLNEQTNFSKICVDSPSECSALCGSFMSKSVHRKEFLIEDVVCFKSELLINGRHSLFERMQKIGKLVQNYRALNSRKPSNFLFDFRGKVWIPNNSSKGVCDFFAKFYRASRSTGSIMFADGRHPENYSKGHMIWSNLHVPFGRNDTMLHYEYLPHFFVQIQVPISVRRSNANFGNQQVGMTNKQGVVQDFNALNTQQIMMSLRNDFEGIWTVMAIKASFDAESMQKLMQISSTNNYRRMILVQIAYNRQKSCYSLKNILNESKITNIVERDAKKFNKMLAELGTNSTVHSASDKEKMALLTSSVTEYVANCTLQIQTCDKEDVVCAFQSLCKPLLDAKKIKAKPKNHDTHSNSHTSAVRHYAIPDPPRK